MTVQLGRSRRRLRIDVSFAVVNIVLLLVFFFVVNGQIASTRQAGQVSLPATTDLPLDRLPRPILVVTAGDEWTLDGQPIASDMLGVAVGNLPAPVTLHVLIDRDAPADSLVWVLSNPALRDVAVRLVTVREGDRGR